MTSRPLAFGQLEGAMKVRLGAYVVIVDVYNRSNEDSPPESEATAAVHKHYDYEEVQDSSFQSQPRRAKGTFFNKCESLSLDVFRGA